VREAHDLFHRYVELWHVDRSLYNDHNAMKKLGRSGEILTEVEKVVGRLD
jgi:hypothetical protein